MNRLLSRLLYLKLHVFLISMYALNCTAGIITSFDDLKRAYHSGATFTAVIDLRLCKPYPSPDVFIGNIDFSSFTPTYVFNSTDKETSQEVFTFISSGTYLKFNPAKPTNPLLTELISQLIVRQDGEVSIQFGSNVANAAEEQQEDPSFFICNWEGLVLRSQ